MTLRVTQRSLGAGSTANLQLNLTRMQKLQEQLSSGKQLNRPSDGPAGTAAALRLRGDLRRNEQLVRNANDGIAWLATADGALTDGLTTIGRVRELALRGMNGSMGAQDRAAMAAEVDALAQHLVGLANTSYLGRPVFGGTTSGSTAYTATGTYTGDSGTVQRTVMEGVAVRVDVTGPEAFGPPGADVFRSLQDIAFHLRTDPSLLTADVAALDTRTLTVKNALANVGARYHEVEVMRDRTEGVGLHATTSLAEVESIDLPHTIMELSMQEVAYQAALGATARVVQPSLLDFLR